MAPCERAATIQEAAAPAMTGLAAGFVKVLVVLKPDGSVDQVRVLKSSGDKETDAAVVSAAERSTYLPARHNCIDVAGRYLWVFGH